MQPYYDSFLNVFIFPDTKNGKLVRRVDVVQDETTKAISLAKPSKLTSFALKSSKSAIAVRAKEYLMVNQGKKANIYGASTLINVANAESKKSDKVFGVYHFRKNLILMFDDGCKVAIHKKKSETKYELVKEI